MKSEIMIEKAMGLRELAGSYAMSKGMIDVLEQMGVRTAEDLLRVRITDFVGMKLKSRTLPSRVMEKVWNLHLVLAPEEGLVATIADMELGWERESEIKKMGVKTVRELAGLPNRVLLDRWGWNSMRRIRRIQARFLQLEKKVAKRLEGRVTVYREKGKQFDEMFEGRPSWVRDVLDTMKSTFDHSGPAQWVTYRTWYTACLEAWGPDADIADWKDRVYGVKIVRERMKERVRTWIPKETLVAVDDLVKKMPVLAQHRPAMELVLKELEAEHFLDILPVECDAEGRVMVKRRLLTLEQFARHIRKEKDRTIVQRYLRGDRLREIGKDYGCTRERIRQIVFKAFLERPPLEEDQYQYLLDTYRFHDPLERSWTEFVECTGLSIAAFRYLRIFSKDGGSGKNSNLQDIATDMRVPEAVRLHAAKYAAKKAEEKMKQTLLMPNGELVPAIRREILAYYMREYCRKAVSDKQFLRGYHAFLKKLEGVTDEMRADFWIDDHVVPYLEHVGKLMTGGHKSVRYYDIDAYDVDAFGTMIDWNRYKNQRISAQKILTDYPEVAKKYDLHDANELHYFIRCLQNQKGLVPEVKLARRMPNLEVLADESVAQARAFLEKHSPIQRVDFIQQYCEMNHLNPVIFRKMWAYRSLAKYAGKGNADDAVYSMRDEKRLSDEQVASVKAVMVDDFYTLDEFRSRMMQALPDADRELVNRTNALIVGYVENHGAYYRKENPIDQDWLLRLAKSSDGCIDLSDASFIKPTMIPYLREELRLARDAQNAKFIEVESDRWITLTHVNSAYGVTKADLRSFVSAIENFVKEGEIETLFSIEKKGFVHPLETKVTLGNFFQMSVLMTYSEKLQFAAEATEPYRCFCKGQTPSIPKLLEQVVEHSPKKMLSISILKENLEKEYGIQLASDAFRRAIAQSALQVRKNAKSVVYLP